MNDPPRVVDTPEKAAVYARSLIQKSKRLERMFTGVPGHFDPLHTYFDDLPETAQDELLLRFGNLKDRMEQFIAARHGRICPVCGHIEAVAARQVQHMEEHHPEVIEQRLTDAGFEKREDGVWVDTQASDD